jgi:hypothetical protein
LYKYKIQQENDAAAEEITGKATLQVGKSQENISEIQIMAAEARDEGNEVVAQARAQTSHRETRGVKNETRTEITAKEEMIEYRDSNFKESNGMFEPNMNMNQLSQETKSNITPSNDETIRNEFGAKIHEDVKNAY